MADEKIQIPLRCSWLVGTRRAHGYLIVEKDVLHLICLLDDSETAGAAGNAAAGQFGLIGALVGAGVGAAREGIRAGKLRDVYREQENLPLASLLTKHPMSKSVKLADVTSVKKQQHLAPILETTNGPVSVQADGAGVHEAIEQWTAGGNVQVVVVEPKKMSRTAKLILFGTVPALVVLYLFICLPFAIRHVSVESKAIAAHEAFKKKAVEEQAKLAGAFNAPLIDACKATFAAVPIDAQLGLIGDIPDSAKLHLKEDYYGFPRITFTEPAYSKWSDPRLENNQLHSKWKHEASFGKSYLRMLESPFDWIDRSGQTYGLAHVESAKLLIVAKVLEVNITGNAGRASLAVRALDYASGQTKCEGDLEVEFGDTGYSSVGVGFHMSQALPFALHFPSCVGSSKGPCDNVNRYARLAAPAAPPPVEPAPVAAESSKSSAKKVASSPRAAKSKATAKRRGR